MRDVALKLALLPVLAAQGWRARKTARSLDAPEGARSGVVGQGAPLRLLILGDSSALGVGTRHQRDAISGQLTRRMARKRQVHWTLNAVSGATTAQTLARLKAEESGPFDMAVICLGVNDVTKNETLRRWLGRKRALCETLRGAYGCEHVFVSGMPPIGSFPLLPNPLRWVLAQQGRRWDRALAVMLGGMEGCYYVKAAESLRPEQMSEDGFHPGPQVYAMWAREVMSEMEPFL
ncbi:lysophospholipase L1-like esterase [Litoreibacter ponti]|uniref:Lysophospholipase L1-like esterase n=1 Tax=Litoreibacter ponti TaxID=1510457 RepID=A0A2T6BHT1_9RHOB|nr:SGNH/GDSL hydrolase family protein [Litoreibacter ponti]PTX55614.1 lysophospholipase L1-like esterase [Litoreibacter ponti]